MSDRSVSGIASPTDAVSGSAARSRRRPAAWVIVVIVVLVAGSVSVAIVNPFSSGATSQPGVAVNPGPTALYTVARQDLSSQVQVPATLGYAGSYSVLNQAQGTETAVPTVGHVVTDGQVLYQVSGAPVVLLYGSTPAYRALVAGLTGADVGELNADLVFLGDATSAEIPKGTDAFTYWTELGVEKLQAASGMTADGTLNLGQAVFEPRRSGLLRCRPLSALRSSPASRCCQGLRPFGRSASPSTPPSSRKWRSGTRSPSPCPTTNPRRG